MYYLKERIFKDNDKISEDSIDFINVGKNLIAYYGVENIPEFIKGLTEQEEDTINKLSYEWNCNKKNPNTT